MKNLITKKICYIILLITFQSSSIYALTSDELLQIHRVNTVEMNNIATPQAGSLVYNTTENTLYFYTGTTWKRVRSDGTSTIVQAGSNIIITGNGSSSTPYTIGQ